MSRSSAEFENFVFWSSHDWPFETSQQMSKLIENFVSENNLASSLLLLPLTFLYVFIIFQLHVISGSNEQDVEDKIKELK